MVGISHDTDQRILEQAMNMIRENGEDQLSLRKLARAIGLTTGAFY
ncbi:Transcriptional regulator, TetR family protein, partial [Lacticaseibacillus paracasei subsp. paracasei Lpp71]